MSLTVTVWVVAFVGVPFGAVVTAIVAVTVSGWSPVRDVVYDNTGVCVAVVVATCSPPMVTVTRCTV
ncbi:hypothetical protein C468_17024 [Halorubrum kocurii JCM 14978]|uniref:Uncharacterized protein n=1 Tax=Halorubrum kocurii JCM 14978 TaxID=1230456 RepID=M0NIV4_9EURY|nr:hypothetical protein C468_17024 [Halorubrum kocurii JCM 14978]